tara:strand:- start:7695 stop:8120 length:426 start_codon:yes stop_codon:yes gene_type:complete
MADVERKRVVRGIVIDDEGRILMGTRPQSKNFAGLWELPGGIIQGCETSHGSIEREIKAKTNLDVEDLMFLGEYIDEKTVEGVVYYVSYFRIYPRDLNQFKHVDKNRNPEWDWFPLSNMPREENIFGEIPLNKVRFYAKVV